MERERQENQYLAEENIMLQGKLSYQNSLVETLQMQVRDQSVKLQQKDEEILLMQQELERANQLLNDIKLKGNGNPSARMAIEQTRDYEDTYAEERYVYRQSSRMDLNQPNYITMDEKDEQ